MFHMKYNVIFYTLVKEQLLTRTGIIHHSSQWYYQTIFEALQLLIRTALENGIEIFKTWQRLYTIIWNAAFRLVAIYEENEWFINGENNENYISFSTNFPHI